MSESDAYTLEGTLKNARYWHRRAETTEAENEKLKRQNERLCNFIEAIEDAHKEHLRTGDYARLGMATQDALRALMAPPCA